MQNIYETKLMKKYISTDSYNPGFKKHNLDINKIFMCIGPTGWGKTNFLVNLIQQYHDTFEEIVIYTEIVAVFNCKIISNTCICTPH